MLIIFLMTGKASARCALENVVNMAFCAFYFGVFAFQLERGKVVIEIGGFPAGGFMTSTAVFPEFAFVRIVFQVA